jgi:hypothetical protein
MYKVGDMVEGWVYNDRGEEVQVVGAFMFRTNDPEEYIQDVVIRTADGKTVYIDEQDCRPYNPRKENI